MSFADDLTSVQSDPQAPPPGSFAADLLRAAEKRSTTSLPPLPPLGAVVPPEFGASPAAPAPASSASASPYQPLIDKYAAEYGVPADLIASVIVQESFGNPKAVSPKKAKGLMQLADGTAAMYGVTDPFDPEQNIKAGTAYLKSMLDRYGDENTALAAYNAGPTAVDDHGGIPPYPATQKYVKQVQAGRGGPKGEAGVTPPAPVSGVSPTPAPAPVQMSGVTDPASVRVTEPPYQGETPDLSTGIVTKAGVIQPVPRGQHPLDPLAAGVVAGVPQIGRGVTGGVKAAMAGDPKMAATALSDLAEGSMRVGAPLLVTALVANPLVTVPMVALATVASEQAESFAKKAGWAPEYQRLAGNAAAVAVLGLGARRIVKGIKGVEALAGDVGTQIGTKVAASRAKAEVGKPPALDPFTIDVKPGRPPVDPAGEALIRDIPPTRPMPQAQAAPVEPPVVAPPAMPPAEVVPPVAAQAPPMAREAAIPVTAAPGTWPPTPPAEVAAVIPPPPPPPIRAVVAEPAPPAPAEALPPPVSATPVPPAVARPPATKKRAQVSQVGAVIDDLGWQDTAQMVEMLGMDWELGDNGKVYWRGVSDSARSSGSAGPRYPASDADFLSALRDYTPGEPAVDALVARARTVVSQPVPPATTPPVAKQTVNVRTMGNRLDANVADLAADYKARGLERTRAWDEFIIDRALKPEINAKEFYAVFDSVGTRLLGRVETRDFTATHYDTVRKGDVQVVPIGHGHSFVWADGTTGSDPGPLAERYVPKGETPTSAPPAPAIPGASALRMRDRLAEKKAGQTPLTETDARRIQGYLDRGVQADLNREAIRLGLATASTDAANVRERLKKAIAPLLGMPPPPPSKAEASQAAFEAKKAEAAASKQPWEMTRAEFIPARVKRAIGNREVSGSAERLQESLARAEHRDIVRQAFASGKPVPAEVLKDYPDLVAKPEVPDAAQEPSAEILDARQRAEDGRAVGKGDAEGQAPRAREEGPPEAQGEVAPAKAEAKIETAAEKVVTEIKRVVDTKGVKSAAEVHRRVLAALEAEIGSAADASGLKLVEFRGKAYGGREGRIWVDGTPLVSMDRYGHLKWFDPENASLGELPSVSTGNPGEMQRDALAAIAKAVGRNHGAGTITIEIPGDGEFTVENNPYAIRRVMERIKSGGSAPWKGLDAATLSKREASEAQFDQRKAEADYNKRNADLTPKAKKVKTPPKSDKQARGVTIGHSLQDLARLGERV